MALEHGLGSLRRPSDLSQSQPSLFNSGKASRSLLESDRQRLRQVSWNQQVEKSRLLLGEDVDPQFPGGDYRRGSRSTLEAAGFLTPVRRPQALLDYSSPTRAMRNDFDRYTSSAPMTPQTPQRTLSRSTAASSTDHRLCSPGDYHNRHLAGLRPSSSCPVFDVHPLSTVSAPVTPLARIRGQLSTPITPGKSTSPSQMPDMFSYLASTQLGGKGSESSRSKVSSVTSEQCRRDSHELPAYKSSSSSHHQSNRGPPLVQGMAHHVAPLPAITQNRGVVLPNPGSHTSTDGVIHADLPPGVKSEMLETESRWPDTLDQLGALDQLEAEAADLLGLENQIVTNTDEPIPNACQHEVFLQEEKSLSYEETSRVEKLDSLFKDLNDSRESESHNFVDARICFDSSKLAEGNVGSVCMNVQSKDVREMVTCAPTAEVADECALKTVNGEYLHGVPEPGIGIVSSVDEVENGTLTHEDTAPTCKVEERATTTDQCRCPSELSVPESSSSVKGQRADTEETSAIDNTVVANADLAVEDAENQLAEQMFQFVDANDDDNITQEEFEKALASGLLSCDETCESVALECTSKENAVLKQDVPTVKGTEESVEIVESSVVDDDRARLRSAPEANLGLGERVPMERSTEEAVVVDESIVVDKESFRLECNPEESKCIVTDCSTEEDVAVNESVVLDEEGTRFEHALEENTALGDNVSTVRSTENVAINESIAVEGARLECTLEENALLDGSVVPECSTDQKTTVLEIDTVIDTVDEESGRRGSGKSPLPRLQPLVCAADSPHFRPPLSPVAERDENRDDFEAYDSSRGGEDTRTFASSTTDFHRTMSSFSSYSSSNRPLTAEILNIMKSQESNEYKQTELKKVLSDRRTRLGDSHPETIKCAFHLGILCEKCGQLDEAELSFKEVYESSRDVLGEYHRNTLRAATNLASVLQNQQRCMEAEPLYQIAYEGRKEKLGAWHQDTLRSLYNLGCLLRGQDKLDEAEPLLRELVEGSWKTLGPDHSNTKKARRELSKLMKARGGPGLVRSPSGVDMGKTIS